MMRFPLVPTVALLAIIAILVPTASALAAPSWWPLVPCGLNQPPPGETRLADSYYQPCNQCDLFKLLKNLIDFVLFGITPIIATMFFIWAGAHILIYGAYPGGVAEGQKIFWNTIKALIIIMLAWLITNTLIRSVSNDNVATQWWKYECRATVKEPTIPAPLPPGGVSGALCSDPVALSKKYNEPAQGMNAPELNSLIQCIRGKISGDLGSVYTFDSKHTSCNLTRGNPVCDTLCSHAVNSCHYGGKTGSSGSLAVDYGNQTIGDQIIQAATACGAKSARCETSSSNTVACSDSSATHVHVTAAGCDSN